MLRCQCIDFQIAFKMCHISNHNTVAQKLKQMTDIHQNKIKLDKKHRNKQMVQSFQVLINVHMLNITCHHMPKYFQVSEENHPKKHILVLIQAKHTSVFSEKNQTGGSMTYFFETLWNFLLFYYTPGNSRQTKLRPKTPGISKLFFLGHPWKFHFVFT